VTLFANCVTGHFDSSVEPDDDGDASAERENVDETDDGKCTFAAVEV